MFKPNEAKLGPTLGFPSFMKHQGFFSFLHDVTET